MSLRICHIDDSPMCLEGVKHALGSASHQVIGSFERIQEAISFLENHSCDIVISEVRVAGFDAIDSLEDLRKCNEGMKLVLFSYDENPTHIARATIADVWDFLLKKESVQRLIRSCESTQSSVRPEDSLVKRVKQFLARPPKPVESLAIPFTKREYQILSHLSLGLSNRDISRSLNISIETAKEHVQNILRKLQLNDRTAAAIWAIRNGVPCFDVGPATQ